MRPPGGVGPHWGGPCAFSQGGGHTWVIFSMAPEQRGPASGPPLRGGRELRAGLPLGSEKLLHEVAVAEGVGRRVVP